MRTRILLTILALAIAAAAPVEAQTRKGRKSAAAKKPSIEVLAWVGDQPITRQDLEERIDQLGPQYRAQFQTSEGRKQLLDRMIEEQVWLKAAEQAGVGKRPEVQQRLEEARRNLLVRTYLSEAMQGMPAPSDSAIEAHYEAHKDDPANQSREVIEVRHIQLDSQKDAERVLRRLQRGENFAELAKRLSKDAATKDNGGELGRVERGMPAFSSLGRQTALAESAFVAPVGEPFGPVQSSLGWHVLRVDKKDPPAPLALDALKPRIQAALSRELQEQYYRDRLAAAEKQVKLRWNEAGVDSFLYGSKSAADLFREAQEAPTADERIAGYRLVLERHPGSEFAPQAQFMIGFVYSEEKNDYDSAEAAFHKLIASYPNSELVDSAKWMLEHMRSDAIPDFKLPGQANGHSGSATHND